MNTYISILRGINVSGQKKIKMQELKKMYEGLNYRNVRTYIQSGNVLFDDKSKNLLQLADTIKKEILNHFGFDVPVLVIGVNELRKIIKNSPFAKKKNIDLNKLYVTFLFSEPEQINIEKLLAISFEQEEFILAGKTIYLYYPGAFGKTKLSNNLMENKLKVTASTRNWNTVNMLMSMADEKS